MHRVCSPALSSFAPLLWHSSMMTKSTQSGGYLSNGDALGQAQEMPAYENPRTTKIYDRTIERLTQDDVEKIRY